MSDSSSPDEPNFLDLPSRLVAAADQIDELSRSDIQVLLRLASRRIHELAMQGELLAEMIERRNDADIEDEPPAGNT